MKKYIPLYMIFSIFPVLIFAQQTDENTLIINQYFQNSAVKSNMELSKNTLLIPATSVNLVQKGSGNAIQVTDVQAGDRQNIIQSGNRNNYEFYGGNPANKSTISINQSGDYNSLLIFGENSLMKNASIRQLSNYNSILIRNFKN